MSISSPEAEPLNIDKLLQKVVDHNLVVMAKAELIKAHLPGNRQHVTLNFVDRFLNSLIKWAISLTLSEIEKIGPQSPNEVSPLDAIVRDIITNDPRFLANVEEFKKLNIENKDIAINLFRYLMVNTVSALAEIIHGAPKPKPKSLEEVLSDANLDEIIRAAIEEVLNKT